MSTRFAKPPSGGLLVSAGSRSALAIRARPLYSQPQLRRTSALLRSRLGPAPALPILATPSSLPPRCAWRFPTLVPPTLVQLQSCTVMALPSRSHGSHHHHHHHHHHNNAYLTSQSKSDAGVRITRIGLFSNLVMALVKGVGGYVFHSQAMIADAWHSLTDLASDFLTLATVSWSLKSPTVNFPFGFGKIESLGSLGVSGMLLCGGLFMGWGSLESLHAHFFLGPDAAAELLSHGHHHHHHGHGHGHSHGTASPSLYAAWLAGGTVLVKEWLYHATMKVAREKKSTILASNAVHHRIDSLTGVVTLLAVLGANFLQNAAWLDPVGGLLISIMVVKAGITNSLGAVYELADRGLDAEMKLSVSEQVSAILLDSGPGVDAEMRSVSGVKSGQNFLVDLELAVPGTWTVEQMHQFETTLRTRVGSAVRGVRRVRVRYVPTGPQESLMFDEFIQRGVGPPSSLEPEGNHDEKHDDQRKHR